MSRRQTMVIQRGRPLIDAQISIGLPWGDVADVVVPLLALGGDEVFEQMLAERVAYQVVLLELVERLVQVARQLVDPQVTPLAVTHGEDVLVDWRAGVDVLLDAVQAGAQHDGQREVGVQAGSGMRSSIRVASPRAAGTRTRGLRFFSDH